MFLARRHKKNRFWWRSQLALTIFLLIVLGFLVPKLLKRHEQRTRIEAEIFALQQEINTSESKNSELKKMVEYLESQEFLEEQARLNFNMKKPGEQVVIVKDAPSSTNDIMNLPLNIGPSSTVSFLPGNYQKWFDYFFAPK